MWEISLVSSSGLHIWWMSLGLHNRRGMFSWLVKNILFISCIVIRVLNIHKSTILRFYVRLDFHINFLWWLYRRSVIELMLLLWLNWWPITHMWKILSLILILNSFFFTIKIDEVTKSTDQYHNKYHTCKYSKQ